MALPILVTFSVDKDVVNAYAAQVGMGGATAALTAERIAEVVSGAAAEVCGALRAAGIDPTTVNASPDSTIYALARGAICLLTVPRLLRSVQLQAAPAFDSMVREANEMLKRLRDKPEAWGGGAEVQITAPGTRSTYDTLDAEDVNLPTWRVNSTSPQRRRIGSYRT